MAQKYRLIDSTGRELAEADNVPYFKGFVANLKPGRYMIQEVEADLAGHPHNIRRWGGILLMDDGSVVLNPDHPEDAVEDMAGSQP